MGSPAEALPQVTRETAVEPSRETVALPRETTTAVETTPAPASPGSTEVAASPTPALEDVTASPPSTMAPSGGAVAVAPPTVRERVTKWAQGEVQEFRDGLRREVNDFRSGYEKVRGLFKR